jgi:sugar lactone lactonase YvrE
MRQKLIILALAAAAALALLAAPPLAGAWSGSQPPVLTTFSPADVGSPYGAFARGMAAEANGDLIVALTVWGQSATDDNVGQVWRVTADGGDKTLLAEENLTPYGAFMSVALDDCGRIYVALDDFSAAYGVPDQGPGGPGVMRVDEAGLTLHAMTRVVRLPDGSWANGIAFHKGRLYISDAAQGGVWRVKVGEGVATPSSPWVESALLPAAKPMGIGVTGVAFKGDTLYAAVWDVGRIVRVPVMSNGSPGTPSVLCRQAELKTADGIAFDPLGRLWVAVNGSKTTPDGGLYRVAGDGTVTEIVNDPGWLNYPTQPVFVRTSPTATALYVLNGAYYGFADGSSPNVISLQPGVPGLPLR